MRAWAPRTSGCVSQRSRGTSARRLSCIGAGGPQKLYWIIKRGNEETIAAVDKFSYTFDAGRVVADTALVLQFKAVYANEVKTRNIKVSIKEDLPEPVFSLKAPRPRTRNLRPTRRMP